MKIVKYNNRKLYNTNTSTYITLEDVMNYVLTGQDFVVTDRETGTNITNEIVARTLSDLVINKGLVSGTVMRTLIISANEEKSNNKIDTIQEENYTNLN